MRQLILFRHAKTEPFSESGSDETRRLTERGHHDAASMAKALKRFDLTPTAVVISTARRTRETWAEIKTDFPSAAASFSESLYLADPDEIISVVKVQPDTDTLLVIGHNPGIHDLALQMAELGGSTNQEALSNLRVKFSTASAAVFVSREPAPFSIYDFQLTEFLSPKLLSV